MAKSKKKAGAAQNPSTSQQQGKRQPESDIGAQQLSKKSREEALTKPEEKGKEDNGEETTNIEEENPTVNENSSSSNAKKQEEEDNDEEMNNVEEETPNVKVTSTLKANKHQDLQGGGGGGEEEKGLPVIKVGEEEKGIPVGEVEEEEKGLQEEEEEEEEAQEQDNDKLSLNVEEKSPKMDKKLPKKPVATGGNILFVGNLPHSVDRANLKGFFKDVGAVTDVRLAKSRNGSFRGFAHVEFATEAAAKKALEKNGQTLHGRNVILNIAQKHVRSLDEQGQNCTAFVRGFGKKQEEDEIQNSLRKHFGSCGAIVEVRIPKDKALKRLKGFAYIQFVDSGAVSKAVELNGSELDSCTLFVEGAKPIMHGKSGGGRKSGKKKRNPNVP